MARMSASARAARTRNARRTFTELYPNTAEVVRAVAEGWDNHEISRDLDIHVRSVAAIRANVTRGAYAPFVKGNPTSGFRGTCNY